MKARPAPRADTTLVFTDVKGRIVAPGRPVTMGESVFGGLRMLYEVDLADHATSFEFDLPCRSDAYFFHARVRLTWRVHDPEEVVRRRVDDGDRVCQDFVEDAMSHISRRYDLEASDRAEEEMSAALGTHPLEIDRGVTITECRVRLWLDPAAKEHVTKVTRAHHEKKEKVAQHEVDRVAQQHRQELERRDQEEELRLARARQEAEDLASQLRNEAELRIASAREAHELAMKKQRMGFYQQAIQLGNGSLLLLQLTEHPGDVRSVIDLILTQETTVFENNRDFLATLSTAGLLQDADVDASRREALDNLIRSLRPNPVAGIIGRDDPAITARAPDPATASSSASDTPDDEILDVVVDENEDEDEQ
jgi:hypothetical protein